MMLAVSIHHVRCCAAAIALAGLLSGCGPSGVAPGTGAAVQDAVRRYDHAHDHPHPHEHGLAPHVHEHEDEDVPIREEDVPMPADLAEAAIRLRGYCDAIRRALEAGRPHAAHRPLDELDIVLARLMPVVRDSNVPREQWEAVNLARRDLRLAMLELHAAIDEQRAADYAAIAPRVDTAIAAMSAAARSMAVTPKESSSR